MKRFSRAIALLLVASATFTACSNDNETGDEPKANTRAIQFNISEDDYDTTEDVAGTRAAQDKPELVDLGNGLMAEVSVEPVSAADKTPQEQQAATRSIYGPAHYTIRAYQGNTLKGEIKGSFNGTTFTPDAGNSGIMYLEHGHYDFVCFNDKVTANGTTLTVNRADAGTARYTVQRNVLINQDPRQSVAFHTKRAGAFVNVEIAFSNFTMEGATTSITAVGSGSFQSFNLTLEAKNSAERCQYTVATETNSIPETMTYDFTTDTYTYPTMGTVSGNCTFKDDRYNVAPHLVGSIGDRWPIYHDLHYGDYFLPTTDCSKYGITFTFGEIYGHSLVGKTITVPTQKLMEANKQYRIIVKLVMGGYTYLFSDGTTGTLAANPSKTPVGVVVDLYRHLAVALNDVNGPSQYQWANSNSQQTSYTAINYEDLIRQNDGEVFPSNSPAIQAAANYQTTVGYPTTPSSTNQWHVPSVSEFLHMCNSLALLPNRSKADDGTWQLDSYTYLYHTSGTSFNYHLQWPSSATINMTRFDQAFIQAGGTAPSGEYWLNNEVNYNSQYQQATMRIMGNFDIGFSSKQSYLQVRPFIQY